MAPVLWVLPCLVALAGCSTICEVEKTELSMLLNVGLTNATTLYGPEDTCERMIGAMDGIVDFYREPDKNHDNEVQKQKVAIKEADSEVVTERENVEEVESRKPESENKTIAEDSTKVSPEIPNWFQSAFDIATANVTSLTESNRALEVQLDLLRNETISVQSNCKRKTTFIFKDKLLPKSTPKPSSGGGGGGMAINTLIVHHINYFTPDSSEESNIGETTGVEEMEFDLSFCSVPKSKIIGVLNPLVRKEKSEAQCGDLMASLKNGLAANDATVSSARLLAQQKAAEQDVVTGARKTSDAVVALRTGDALAAEDGQATRLQALAINLLGLLDVNVELNAKVGNATCVLAAVLIVCGRPSEAATRLGNDTEALSCAVKLVAGRPWDSIGEQLTLFVQSIPSNQREYAAKATVMGADPASYWHLSRQSWIPRQNYSIDFMDIVKKQLDSLALQLTNGEMIDRRAVFHIDMLPEIVSKALRRRRRRYNADAGQLLRTLSRLNGLDNRLIGYEALCRNIIYTENHGHLVELAARMKREQDMYGYRDKMQIIRSLLPDGIRRLVYDPYISIETEYYVQSFTMYGTYYGNVYTYPYDMGSYTEKRNWLVNIDYVNDRVYFRFRNKYDDQVMYADEYRLYTEKSTGKTRNWWTVMSYGSNDRYYFKNKDNGRILSMGLENTCSKISAWPMNSYCNRIYAYPNYDGRTSQRWKII